MKFLWLSLLSLLPSLVYVEALIPVVDGVMPTTDTFKPTPRSSVATTPGKLRFKKENSGICETTPGVNQVTGYGDISANKSIWFWFFESRKDPDNAPLALWFNGGPGSSSMTGLFQEQGPCRITNDSKSVTLNPFSWNNEANIVFIDQPVGVGFSHGATTVGTSQQAAADIWTFLQIFLADPRFAKYQQNNLAIWTESYGGHYGPKFAAHFLAQNTAIDQGTVQGIKLNLKVLGIGDGLTDPLVQYPGYLTYAANNPYHPLVPPSIIAQATNDWQSLGACRDQILSCYNTSINAVCAQAQVFCNDRILQTLAGEWDVYYVPTREPDPYPPPITSFMNSIAPVIGAEATWQNISATVFGNFLVTGDWMRNTRPDLETIINAGIRTIIYVGDADYILNYHSIEALTGALNTQFSSLFKAQEFSNFTVHGQPAGLFKNAGTFSFVRFFGAGHEVPAYKWINLEVGEAAAQMFTQIMRNQSISAT